MGKNKPEIANMYNSFEECYCKLKWELIKINVMKRFSFSILVEEIKECLNGNKNDPVKSEIMV